MKKYQAQRSHLVLILILVVAAFLRLFRIETLMRFIWDEGRDMLAIRQIIVERDLTLFGPFNEIDGRKDFFGVFQYYLMLPALWIANFSPTGPAVFTALLGVTAVGLAYFWLRQWYEPKLSLAVTAVYGLSPLVVRFNQWAWNPNTIGFFSLLFLIFLLQYRRSHKKKDGLLWASLAGLFLGLLFQLHYFTLALVIPAGLVFLTKPKKNWWVALIFIFSFILPNLSFVIFDLTHEGFYRQILFDSFIGSEKQNFFQFSWFNLVRGPFKYLFEVSHKFTGSIVLAWGVLLAFIYQSYLTIGDIKQSVRKQKNPHATSQLLSAWWGFLLMTSFFPSLLDDYHSGALWLGLALVIVLTLKIFFRYGWLLLASLFIIWLIMANRFWREPDWQENMPRIRAAATAIAQDMKRLDQDSVNLASFVDPETRGIRFRYFVINQGEELLSFDDYPRTAVLYAISPHSWEKTQENPAWELDTFRETSASAVIWRDDGWYVYRVEK